MAQNLKMVFIGGGNMAKAIIAGLTRDKSHSHQIYVVDHHDEKCRALREEYKINATTDVNEVMEYADILILAVKPQDAQSTCKMLKNIPPHALVISFMTGVTLAHLSAWLGSSYAAVRAMPNTPAIVNFGATGLFANTQTNELQKAQAEKIFEAVGIVTWLKKEADINTIIALSGSGPAYYFYFMEVMQKHAEAMGLAPEVAKDFAIQTALGAAQLAANSTDELTTLRANVTSKGGTTAAAINVMQEQNLAQILAAAMEAASKRALELSEII